MLEDISVQRSVFVLFGQERIKRSHRIKETKGVRDSVVGSSVEKAAVDRRVRRGP